MLTCLDNFLEDARFSIMLFYLNTGERFGVRMAISVFHVKCLAHPDAFLTYRLVGLLLLLLLID